MTPEHAMQVIGAVEFFLIKNLCLIVLELKWSEWMKYPISLINRYF